MVAEIGVPVFVAVLILIVGIFANWIVDVDILRPDSPERGTAWFRSLYLAPDFCIISLALMASSNAMTNLLNQKQVPSLLGGQISSYFWIFIMTNLVILSLTSFIWLMTKYHHVLPTKKVKTTIPRCKRPVSEYKLQFIVGVFRSQGGLLNLVLGNGLGLFTLFLFGLFIYANFIRRPIWLP